MIAITRCASRTAGIACAGWLVLFGVLGKVAAFFAAIPACVLGGMTTFLFANVTVSGFNVLTMSKMDRRSRFIVACALGVGFGVIIRPQWAETWLVVPRGATDVNPVVAGIREGISIVLSTGYCIGSLTAVVLHLILPFEKEAKDMHTMQELVTGVEPRARGASPAWSPRRLGSRLNGGAGGVGGDALTRYAGFDGPAAAAGVGVGGVGELRGGTSPPLAQDNSDGALVAVGAPSVSRTSFSDGVTAASALAALELQAPRQLSFPAAGSASQLASRQSSMMSGSAGSVTAAASLAAAASSASKEAAGGAGSHTTGGAATDAIAAIGPGGYLPPIGEVPESSRRNSVVVASIDTALPPT